jgi:hypothetical protein
MILLPPTIPALAADFACLRPDYRVSFQDGQTGCPFHSHLIRFQNNTSPYREWAVSGTEKSGKKTIKPETITLRGGVLKQA